MPWIDLRTFVLSAALLLAAGCGAPSIAPLAAPGADLQQPLPAAAGVPTADPWLAGYPGSQRVAPPPAAEGLLPAPLSAQEREEALHDALAWLERGQEQDARSLLAQILHADAGHAAAASLLRQINLDAEDLFGRAWVAYRVAGGDTLRSIARAQLKDSDLFHALARFNGLKLPATLSAGQMLRIPIVRAPALAKQGPAAALPPAAAAASAAPAAPTMPAVPVAPLAPLAQVTQVTQVAVPPGAANQRQISEHAQAAKVCSLRQDPCCAAAAWAKVLELDPEHRRAAVERERELALAARLRRHGSAMAC